MAYLPIEHHGVIGDLHTAALVGNDGSIDWLCLPHFDSPSVFASILDDRKGGRFRIAANTKEARRRQMYLPDTNVLLTRFLTPDGVGEIIDFMPIAARPKSREDHRVIRLVRGVRGAIPFLVGCRPAFHFATRAASLERAGDGWRWTAGDTALDLATPLDMRRDGNALRATFTLHAGDEIPLVLRHARRDDAPPRVSLEACLDDFRATVRFWQSWIAGSHYQGRWREMVKRSCLALKLLTFAPTGAIVASPTTSLPERIGGPRNWDYRYVWIRDAAFTLYALLRVGFQEEAAAFMNFVEARCREIQPGDGLRTLYGIDGRHDVPETVLDHLEGYRGSAPVRVGNDAAGQLQLDIGGELIDSLYLFDKYARPIPWDVWLRVRDITDWICEHWNEDEEYARHCVRRSPHQPVVVVRDCAEHRPKRPGLGVNLTIHVSVFGGRQTGDPALDRLAKRTFTRRLRAGLAHAKPKSNIELSVNIGKGHVGLNQEEQHAARQI